MRKIIVWSGIGVTLLLAAAALSCSGHDSTSPVPVAGVSVRPESTSPLEPGATLQLTATAVDASGNALAAATVSWSSTNSQIATVTATGLVTAVEPGSTTIVATASGHSGSTTVTVNQPVAMVSIVTPPTVMGVGGTVLVYGFAQDPNGNALAGQTLRWTSSNTAVATVTAAGPTTAHLVGVTAGTVTITATCGGVSGTASVNVVAGGVVASLNVQPTVVEFENASPPVGLPPANVPVQFGAKLEDVNEVVLSGFPIAWSSSDTTVATVSATGLVTPNLAVTNSSFATITATSEGVSGHSSVTVNPTVATIRVTPSVATIAVGDTILLVATTYDANGHLLQGVPMSWGNDNGRKTVLLPSGLDSLRLIAVSQGNDVIVASDGASGVYTQVDITVTSTLGDATRERGDLGGVGAPKHSIARYGPESQRRE